ncbi:MAG: FKBP-type peptidyl-prolyl cis-trans isomerase [Coriobacteriia bacterium]|nr:FKBP-type peptidyl-prolyl cis-trans isomerase [Coriobacteriia bacterium]
MKKTVLIIGILLGAMMVLTACGGNGDNGDDVTTPNGGDASTIVESGDTVSVEYTGRLLDGEVFDTSEGSAPLTFVVDSGMMIPGFDAAVLGMSLNQEKTVQIPAAEAYGEQGVQNPQTGEYLIPPNADIEFDIKVVDIQKANAQEAPAELAE